MRVTTALNRRKFVVLENTLCVLATPQRESSEFKETVAGNNLCDATMPTVT